MPKNSELEHAEELVFISPKRNYLLSTFRRDGLIEWMKDMMNHSFVLDAAYTYLDTMTYFEELINEHRLNPDNSRLKSFVPTVFKFFTPLPMRIAFKIYDSKYNVTKRHFVPPSFNEIRHTLNLAQVLAIGKSLSMITFDGDQTLYSDGGNFEENPEISDGIVFLLSRNVKVCVVTAAGYGFDGSKYETRLKGLLEVFVSKNLSVDVVSNFYVLGGECNYLLKCHLVKDSFSDEMTAKLLPVPYDIWQDPSVGGPRPAFWPSEQVTQILDIANEQLQLAMSELSLRGKIIRKERAVGIIPGGIEMIAKVPQGHGSRKIKREALDEIVLRITEALRVAQPPITLPFCVFNGGSDAWVDIGNKSIGVSALQHYFSLDPSTCIHVGDQVCFFLLFFVH